MNKKTTNYDELELYDGQRASLPDKKVTTDYIPGLSISARGKEIFALSENLYCKWLETQDDYSLVTRAIDLCRQAVALGYPHAVVKMGYYYDKDYIDSDRMEEYRCRVATDYYSKVVYADRPPITERGVTSEIAWEDLRKMSARLLLEMLSSSSEALTRDVNNRYGYSYNRKEIASLFPDIKAEGNLAVKSRSKDMEKALQEVLKYCKTNKYRAPLFGVLKMNVAEVLRAFSKDGFAWQASKNINVYLIAGEWVAKAGATQDFHTRLNERFANCKGDGKVWVCFFNVNSDGHRFVNEKSRNAICNYCTQDGLLIFKELTKAAELQNRNMLIFSDDDVELHRKHTPLEGAKILISTVTQSN